MPNIQSIVDRRSTIVKKGFTLIELLIVISIIGILASLTLASFGSAQAKARDGVRKSDLAQVKRALELAKADCEGNAYYPYIGDSSSLGNAQTNYTGLMTYLTNSAWGNNKYLSSAITDPSNGATQIYSYFTTATNANKCADILGAFTQGGAIDYVLAVQLERVSDKGAADSRTKCAGKIGTGIWNVAGYYVTCNN